MESDLLDAYERASEWTGTKVAGATTQLDAATLCDGWDVRTLMNHMLDTQRYFGGVARGENVSPPSPVPPQLLGDDPVTDFERDEARPCVRSRSRELSRRLARHSGSRSATSFCMVGTWRGRLRRMRLCRQGWRRRHTR